MQANIFMILRLLLLIGSITYARECNGYERDKAEYHAEKAGEEMVSDFGGGRNIRVDLSSCSYNSYSKIFKLNVQIHWDGALWESNHYEIDGILKLDSNGNKLSFAKTYANDNVKDLDFYKNMARGALIFAALANNTDTSHHQETYSGPTYKVRFSNYCKEKVRVAINYLDSDYDWVTVSWWVFDPYESKYLVREGSYVKSVSKTIYYYVEDMDSHPLIKGEHRKFDPMYEKYYPMRKYNSPYSDIRIQCK